MWNKIKAFFSGEDSAQAVTDERNEDYTVRKNRKFDMLARVLAVLAALTLWIYVVSTTTVSEEQDFSLIPVTCSGAESLRSEQGLVVQSISIDTLNVRLMGNRQDLRKVTGEQIKAYVSLADIRSAGEYQLKVYVDVPSGITVVSQSVSQVVVEVDRTAQKQFDLKVDSGFLRGWKIAAGCSFGEIRLDEKSGSSLTVEGPTLSLNKVHSVALTSDVIGEANGSFTVTATPKLLDAKGNVITDSALTIRETDPIQVNVKVIKIKDVPLVIEGKYGYLTADLYTLDHKTVTISGEPGVVDATDSLTLAVVDERALKDGDTKNFILDFPGLDILDENNKHIVQVKVTYDLSALPVHEVKNVPVFWGSKAIGSATVTVRGVSPEVSAIVQAIGRKEITVYVENIPETNGDREPLMTAVLAEALRAYVYAIEISDYDNTPPSDDVTGNLDHIVTPMGYVG